MKVTGHLKEPVLDPCPNRDDLQTLVDDTCAPAQCTRPRGGTDPGVDCCHFWNAPDSWQEAKVRVDQIDPEKFKYEQYRYQLYAKPIDFDCTHGEKKMERVPDRHYESPVTDIRALRQTTVVPVMNGAPVAGAGIPVVPSNPGGVSEVTFPMTQSTLGQPDVTTACCVPVVPCQQGYQNLTPGIKRGALRCQQPPQPGRPHVQLGQKRLDPCVDNSDCIQKQQQQMQPSAAPQQYMMPPVNQQGPGFAPAFPQNQQAYTAPQVPQLNPPKPEFKEALPKEHPQNGDCVNSGNFCFVTGMEDGLNPRGGADTACTNVSSFRYQDRILREFHDVKETPAERRSRLTRMFGAYGSALQPKQCGKRSLVGPKDNIVLQGNGFTWGGYPKHENRLCYVLERNPRC